MLINSDLPLFWNPVTKNEGCAWAMQVNLDVFEILKSKSKPKNDRNVCLLSSVIKGKEIIKSRICQLCGDLIQTCATNDISVGKHDGGRFAAQHSEHEHKFIGNTFI